MPVPISLLVDNPCPLVHVYRFHTEDVDLRGPKTGSGARMVDTVPNDFLDRFCDVVQRRSIAGKFSIVPSPAGKGDIVSGIEGFDPQRTRDWIDTAKRRLGERFDFCPEGITHNLAVNLEDGGYFDQGEADWSQNQSVSTLTSYLVRQFEYLRDAGIDATGFTSPWLFGMDNENAYRHAMAAAQRQVCGRDTSWYFLHMLDDQHDVRPWIAYVDGVSTLVSIPSTVTDVWWQTIDSERTDRGYIDAIRRVLDDGGWPVLLSHWQSFFSNGLETGLSVLDEIGRRIEMSIPDEVEWHTCTQLMRKALEEPVYIPGGLR